jgi:hypothetical protein
MLISRFKE